MPVKEAILIAIAGLIVGRIVVKKGDLSESKLAEYRRQKIR